MHVASGQFRRGGGTSFWRGHALDISGVVGGRCFMTKTSLVAATLCRSHTCHDAVMMKVMLSVTHSYLGYWLTHRYCLYVIRFPKKTLTSFAPQNRRFSANMASLSSRYSIHHALTWVSRLFAAVFFYYLVTYLPGSKQLLHAFFHAYDLQRKCASIIRTVFTVQRTTPKFILLGRAAMQ